MIEIAKANPDIETLKLTLWIAASIIALLLAIVAFFLLKQIKVQESLIIAVNQLTTMVSVIQNQQDERDPRTERRLNEHSKKLGEHESRLLIVETRCVINHKNTDE